jgi:succinyl-CoA synthetase beta subunit
MQTALLFDSMLDFCDFVRLQGTNAEEGRRLLNESALEFIVAETLDEAALKAVEAGQ